MSGKTGCSGRPFIPDEIRKDNRITIRLTTEETELLNLYCNANSVSKADAIRAGIKLLISCRKNKN